MPCLHDEDLQLVYVTYSTGPEGVASVKVFTDEKLADEYLACEKLANADVEGVEYSMESATVETKMRCFACCETEFETHVEDNTKHCRTCGRQYGES